jgi:integrase
MNSYLKEIGDICDIRKSLTFHLARHTFATTVTLANGVPIESVSKMLGHKKIATTQVYAKVIGKKLSEDMDVLKENLFKVAALYRSQLYTVIYSSLLHFRLVGALYLRIYNRVQQQQRDSIY